MAITSGKKHVTIESPASSTISYADQLLTPPRKEKHPSLISPGKSSSRKVLLVATPSSRPVVTNRSLFSDRKLAAAVSPTRRKSPQMTIAKSISPSKIREPSSLKSSLRMKPQRDSQLAIANSARKIREAESLSLMTPSRSALGKPQRLFSSYSSRDGCNTLLMSESRSVNRQKELTKRDLVSPPRLYEQSSDSLVGLKSPARRLNSSIKSTSTRKSHKDRIPLALVMLSPPKMAPLSANRAANKKRPPAPTKNVIQKKENYSNESKIKDLTVKAATPTKKRGRDGELVVGTEQADNNNKADTDDLERAYGHLSIQNQELSTQTEQIKDLKSETETREASDLRYDSSATGSNLDFRLRTSTTKIPTKSPHDSASASQIKDSASLSFRRPSQTSLPRLVHNGQNVNLKANAAVPSLVRTTVPAPSGPLFEVVAYLDIRTDEGDDASATFKVMISKLGAKVVKQPSRTVTHIIYKKGSPKTMHVAKELGISCLSISWIIECNKQQKRMPETEFLVSATKSSKSMHHRVGEE